MTTRGVEATFIVCCTIIAIVICVCFCKYTQRNQCPAPAAERAPTETSR